MVGTNGAVDHTFPDAREYDIRSCCRMFGNCATKTPADGLVVGTMNVWLPTTGNTGTIDLNRTYDSNASQRYNFRLPANTPSPRCAFSDRPGGQNTHLMAGMFEMDCTARVRWLKSAGTNDGSVPRIGFSAGHITYIPITDAAANPFYACVAFTCYGLEQTWFAHLSVNGQNFVPGMTGNGPDFYERRVNTNVPISDWNTLHVWISRDGKQAEFFANGILVHRETDPEYIPRRDNYRGSGPSILNEAPNPLSGANGNTLNNGGFTLRGEHALATPVSVELDWVRTRYFLKR